MTSMRTLLENSYTGKRLYVFTTQGQVYIGTFTGIVDDVVQILGLDRATRIHLNLRDISGVRGYDAKVEDPP